MSKRVSIALLALAVLLLVPSHAQAQGTEQFVAFLFAAPVSFVLGGIFIFLAGRRRVVLTVVLLLTTPVIEVYIGPGWFGRGMGLAVLAMAVMPVCVCILVAVLLNRATMSGPERLVYLAVGILGIVGPTGVAEYRHRHEFDPPPAGYKEPDRSGVTAWGAAFNKIYEGMPAEEAVRTVTPAPERIETPTGTAEDPRCRVKYIWKIPGSDLGSYICVDTAGLMTSSVQAVPLGTPPR